MKLSYRLFVVMMSILFATSAQALHVGSIFDSIFHTTQSPTYFDDGNRDHHHVADTTFLYEKFSDYYCIEAFGQELCGYDCRPGETHSNCGLSQDAKCTTNDYGVVSCGYDCSVDGHDMACGTKVTSNCFRDGFTRLDYGPGCSGEGCTFGHRHSHAPKGVAGQRVAAPTNVVMAHSSHPAAHDVPDGTYIHGHTFHDHDHGLEMDTDLVLDEICQLTKGDYCGRASMHRDAPVGHRSNKAYRRYYRHGY